MVGHIFNKYRYHYLWYIIDLYPFPSCPVPGIYNHMSTWQKQLQLWCKMQQKVAWIFVQFAVSLPAVTCLSFRHFTCYVRARCIMICTAFYFSVHGWTHKLRLVISQLLLLVAFCLRIVQILKNHRSVFLVGAHVFKYLYKQLEDVTPPPPKVEYHQNKAWW